MTEQQDSDKHFIHTSRRLRKQPKVRRIQSVTVVPLPQPTAIPRTARRRRRRNRRQQRLPLGTLKKLVFTPRWISLSLLVITIYALALIGLDMHFYLTYIPVEGIVSIPPAEIVAASGLAGAHVFAVDPNQAAAQIDHVPGVVSTTVTLNWPNEVSIQVAEDSPVAVWQQGTTQHWVTKDGRLMPARAEAFGLLVIESEFPTSVQQVVPDDDSNENIDTATGPDFIDPAILAGALQLRQLNPALQRLTYRPSTGLTFTDERGWLAHFGTGTDMVQKTAVYEAIVTDLQARNLTPAYISVSNQEKPYYQAR